MTGDFFENEWVNRFENMIESNENWYFESDEMTEIIGFYLDVGDLQLAGDALEYAYRLHPGNTSLKIKELEYYMEANQMEDAQAMIAELDNLNIQEFDFDMAKGTFWSLQSQCKKAIKFFRQALKHEIQEGHVHYCLGLEYVDLKELGKALSHFKQALEIDLDDDMAFSACIECFDNMHRTRVCIDFLNQYLDLKPFAFFAWNELGVQYKKIKKYDKAIDAFEYSIAINQKGIFAFLQKAHCLESLNKYQEAIETYEEAASLEDSAANIYCKIGYCYQKLEKRQQAFKAFHKAIHEDPQLDMAWVELAAIYEKIGQYAEAVYYLQRAIDLDGNQTDYHRKMILLCMQLADFNKAELHFIKLLKLEPEHYLNWYGFAELLILMEDYTKALKLLNRAVARFSKTEFLYQLSNCYYAIGNEKLGDDFLKKAYSKNPKSFQKNIERYPALMDMSIKHNLVHSKK